MLHKGWKLFFAISAILLVGLVVWGIFFRDSVPRLSREEKDAVRTEYINRKHGGKLESYVDRPIIWYDENGHVEKESVWRYIGTYGDCYAFLEIGDNKDWDMPTQGPYPLAGLARKVEYPNEARVYLYHTTKEFNSKDVSSQYSKDFTLRMMELYQIKNLEEWITDKELVQLTLDIEELAKKHN